MNEKELMSMFEKDSYPNSNCIRRYHIKEFENIIRDIVTKHKLEIAKLEAKVYAYEKIIANSNFSAILKENKETKEEVDYE